MADIEELIERLKQAANGLFPASPLGDYGVCDEAATALSAQQSEIAELREALRQIAWARPFGDENMARNTRQLLVKAEKIALAALNKQESQK